MEHLVHTYKLLVNEESRDRAGELISAAFTEEIFFIILLDREHHILVSPDGFPREAIDSAADAKHFSFAGEYSSGGDSGTGHSVFQFFMSKRRKEKISIHSGGYSWKPLHELLGDPSTHPSFRRSYIELMLDGFEPPAAVFSAWGFGASPADADSLGKLVREGKKRATAGLTASYEAEGEALPRPGDVSVILNGVGKPVALIRTTDLTVLPFREVTAEMAAEEGEGDLSLEYWQKAHRKFFKQECRQIGRSFSEEMDVVFERFELLKVL